MLRSWLTLLVAALFACGHVRTAAEVPTPGHAEIAGCGPLAPAPAAPYIPNQAEPTPSLAGRYRLVSVSTSIGGTARASHARLKLAATDSAFRPATPGNQARVLWLAGSLTVVDSAGVPRTDEQGKVLRDTVQVELDQMFFGCRRCFDGAIQEYRIIARTEDGQLWGHWVDPQTGIGRLVDSAGNRLPNPAGHFCAWLLEPGA